MDAGFRWSFWSADVEQERSDIGTGTEFGGFTSQLRHQRVAAAAILSPGPRAREPPGRRAPPSRTDYRRRARGFSPRIHRRRPRSKPFRPRGSAVQVRLMRSDSFSRVELVAAVGWVRQAGAPKSRARAWARREGLHGVGGCLGDDPAAAARTVLGPECRHAPRCALVAPDGRRPGWVTSASQLPMAASTMVCACVRVQPSRAWMEMPCSTVCT